MSRLGDAYTAIYTALCGRHPRPYPWHFQWHGMRELEHDLRTILAPLGGAVLDLGCGKNPYRAYFSPQVSSYVGADVAPGPGVDIIIRDGEPLPFADASFDTILCTQVVEHVGELEILLAEVSRVLRPGGTFVVSVPFLFHLHGAPYDFRRYTATGLERLLADGYDVLFLKTQGRVGSHLAITLLAWAETQSNSSLPLRLLKGMLLPVWMTFCLLTNTLGLLTDALDNTGCFAHNSLAIARRKPRDI